MTISDPSFHKVQQILDNASLKLIHEFAWQAQEAYDEIQIEDPEPRPLQPQEYASLHLWEEYAESLLKWAQLKRDYLSKLKSMNIGKAEIEKRVISRLQNHYGNLLSQLGIRVKHIDTLRDFAAKESTYSSQQFIALERILSGICAALAERK